MHDFGRIPESELETLARRLGQLLEAGDVVLFEGEMGAGKTTFTRALAQGMKVERPDSVCSPTYTIAMTHPGPVGPVHLDLFRFGEMSGEQAVRSASFEALGLEYDQLPPPGHALVVEWSELWADPPQAALRVFLTRHAGDEGRRQLRAAATTGRGLALLEGWSGQKREI